MVTSFRQGTRILPPVALAIVLLATFSAQASAQASTPVCFWSAQGPVCVERAAGVSATGLDPQGLLEALLTGPTPQERARGLWSAIPQGTALDAVEIRADQTVIVRLSVPVDALRSLDHTAFEIIVNQIGSTLEPLRWRGLRIQAWDPVVRAYVPLAIFLPESPLLRKDTVLSGEESPPLPATRAGQPPAPGQGQPQGALSGKTVYVSAGHGWQWNGYAWRVQRIPYPLPPYVGPFIEDHNNAEVVNQYLLQYLWNAGAQVWPVRERDMNAAEAIVDNDAPAPGTGYFETGVWTPTGDHGTGYAGTDYRYAATAIGGPTATAVWTATLPTAGRYAVYAWYRAGDNRAPDVHYTVHHAGGDTVVIVNQEHHGSTWHYVGTYGFRAGEEARVTLTNQSGVTGRVVIADAVRFGGGTFDNLTGIDTEAPHAPHKPWWEVAAYYQVQRMGLNPDDWPYFNDVVARPMYARWEHAATGDDAVYVSWHTNGYNGYQTTYRGTLSIVHNGEGNPVTPGSVQLRDAIHAELVHDVRAGWDPTWPGLTRSMNLGELRELWDSVYPLPGALIEIAYHDNPTDADALKEPAFQMLAARAVYQGIVHYFAGRDGIDLVELPEPPTHLAVQNVGSGQVRVSWQPSPADGIGLTGDPATGYRVYTSADGLGWSNGIPVTGATAYTLTGLVPWQLLFVRVSATNGGGESFPTETLGVRIGDDAQVLLINGFDRLNRSMLVPESDPVEGYNVRMFLDRMNRYDYAIQHGQAISYPFDSASNEAVQTGWVSLGGYGLVDWILGEESTRDETLNGTEQALLGNFLGGGGALFISGAEVGWDLDYLGSASDRAFYNGALRAGYVGDDAGTYAVVPAAGSIFAGLVPFRFDAPGMYDADYPDQIAPIGGSVAALAYSGGVGGTAALQYANGCERLVYLGFPFETIWPETRSAVMGRVLDFLDECLPVPVSVDTAITSPANGSAYNTVPPFTGTAAASGAAVQRVEVQVQHDGQYWTGSGWVTTATWLAVSGTTAWSYVLPPLGDGDYSLRARAWTTAGMADTSPAEVVFIYDTISPASTTLITPTGGITLTAVAVRMEWQPLAPDGGSSLAYAVALDGQSYTTTQAVYTVTHVAAGPHTWGVQVFDAAGNRSAWATGTFVVSQSHCWLPLVMRNFVSPPGPGTCTDAIVNGGFETSGGWVLNRLAVYDTTYSHSGTRSARVGIPPGEPGIYAYSSVSQTLALPAGSTATLRLWVYPINEGNDPDDQHYIWLFDQWEGYDALDRTATNGWTWVLREYDVSAYSGQTVRLFIGAKNDGDDDTAALYVDDVTLEVCP